MSLKFSDFVNGEVVEISDPMISLELDRTQNIILLNVAGLRFILRGINNEQRKSGRSNGTKKILEFLLANPNKPFNLKMLDGELDRNFNSRLDDILRKGLRPLPPEKIKCFCKNMTTSEVIFCPQMPLGDFLEADKTINVDFGINIKHQSKLGVIRQACLTFEKKSQNTYRVGFAFYNRVENGDDVDLEFNWFDEANFWHRYDLSANCKTNFSISMLSSLA